MRLSLSLQQTEQPPTTTVVYDVCMYFFIHAFFCTTIIQIINILFIFIIFVVASLFSIFKYFVYFLIGLGYFFSSSSSSFLLSIFCNLRSTVSFLCVLNVMCCCWCFQWYTNLQYSMSHGILLLKMICDIFWSPFDPIYMYRFYITYIYILSIGSCCPIIYVAYIFVVVCWV